LILQPIHSTFSAPPVIEIIGRIGDGFILIAKTQRGRQAVGDALLADEIR